MKGPPRALPLGVAHFSAMLHIEHKQPARGQLTWCGVRIAQGPRIVGVENFIYYEGPGPVCPACIEAILDVVAAQIAKGNSHAQGVSRESV